MLYKLAMVILCVLLAIQTFIKYSSDESKRRYRIVKRTHYKLGTERYHYWYIYKQVNLLGIKYWTKYKDTSGDFLIPMPKTFHDLETAENVLLNLITNKPVSGFKDTIEKEWTRSSDILNK